MRTAVGGRLVPLSTLLFATLSIGIVLLVALFAFGTYVKHLRAQAHALLGAAITTALDDSPRGDAGAAARGFAPQLTQSALFVVFIDPHRRALVLRGNSSLAARPEIFVRPATDRRVPEASGVVARMTLGLATAFGLRSLRTEAGSFEINVEPNAPRLVAAVTAFLPALLVAIVVAAALAALVAPVLGRSALRPLTEVTLALERFARGDFTPATIETRGDERLTALASAFNGAVRQVESAFAERAHANATMRQFIADGGHQLRTPLTVVRGFVGILRSGFREMEPAEVDHVLAAMAQQTLVMSTMIDRLILLDAWEHDAAEAPLRLDLAELVREVLAPFALAHPGRTLGFDAAGETAVTAVEGDLREAVTNVIDNALKYTNGPVAVSVRGTARCAEIRVADAGPGMGRAELAHASDRFYRGSRRDVAGSGLGLAIARRAVERGRGAFRIESSPEAGTVVVLELPVA